MPLKNHVNPPTNPGFILFVYGFAAKAKPKAIIVTFNNCLFSIYIIFLSFIIFIIPNLKTSTTQLPRRFQMNSNRVKLFIYYSGQSFSTKRNLTIYIFRKNIIIIVFNLVYGIKIIPPFTDNFTNFLILYQ